MDLFNAFNNILWDYVVVAVLILSALWFTVKTNFFQFTMLPEMFRVALKSNSIRGDKDCNISSFQAFIISLASRVGVGNLAGVALAITIGGAGAVFWMWVMAVVSAASAFVESTLAQLYKVRAKDSFMGGAAYYIERGLKNRNLAVAVAVLNICTFSFATCSIQSNTIAISNIEAFGISKNITALMIAVIMSLIIFGGIRRISKFSKVIVPVMALMYIVVSIFVIVTNISDVPHIFATIIKSAFGFDQVGGGLVGTAFMIGTKRGLFSNEAGMSSAPNIASTADVLHPINQGFMQALGVFVDTLVICSCTAFIILLTLDNLPEGATGIALTQYSLSKEIGAWGYQFIAILVLFFGFSTCISNAYYGETNVRFIKNRASLVNIFRVTMIIIVVIGALIPLDMMWSIMDFCMAFMILFNLMAISRMGGKVYLLYDNYKQQKKSGISTPVFNKKDIPQLDVEEVECW